MKVPEENEWANLTPEEKKRKLYEKQKALLDTFLEHRAISQQQYDKSLGDLTEKMGLRVHPLEGDYTPPPKKVHPPISKITPP